MWVIEYQRLVSGHFSKGLLELLGDGLVLLLLRDQLILQPVHLLLQILHGHPSEPSASLGLLQLGAHGLDKFGHADGKLLATLSWVSCRSLSHFLFHPKISTIHFIPTYL